MRGSHKLVRGNSKTRRTGSIADFPAGARIFDLDHPCRRVYQLRAGRVQISSGREAILDYLKVGDFFGEESLLARSQRSQIAKSLTRVAVSTFRSSQLLDRLQQDRLFARRFLKNLALRLDGRRQAIRDFVTEPAERRLARLLLRLTPRQSASGWVRLNFSPSNSEMARAVGTTRGRISNFMTRFRNLGWLQRRPDVWVRREGLREFLELPSPADGSSDPALDR